MATRRRQTRPGSGSVAPRARKVAGKGGPRAGLAGLGRPRSERSRQAILSAVRQLLESQAYSAITIEAIATQGRVGKQTIYRWWSSKAEIVLEAFIEATSEPASPPDTGTLAGDLSAFVANATREARRSAPVLRILIAEAQLDDGFARRFRAAFIAARRRDLGAILRRASERGELTADADHELLMDLIHGPLWYRVLERKGPLNRRFADGLVAAVLVAAGASTDQG